MSGIYVTVWDDLKLLKAPTMGGWPHVTIGYCGDRLSDSLVKEEAIEVFKRVALKDIVLSEAYVNSFTPGGSDKMRHDVLLRVDPESEGFRILTEARAEVTKRHTDAYWTGDLHVTYKICDTQEEAEKLADDLNQSVLLPTTAVMTGVTVD